MQAMSILELEIEMVKKKIEVNNNMLPPFSFMAEDRSN